MQQKPKHYVVTVTELTDELKKKIEEVATIAYIPMLAKDFLFIEKKKHLKHVLKIPGVLKIRPAETGRLCEGVPA